MVEAVLRHHPADDLLARAVEALAVLLDAGISPIAVWAYVAEDTEHAVVRAAAARIAAGVPPAEAIVEAARRRGAETGERRWLRRGRTPWGIRALRGMRRQRWSLRPRRRAPDPVDHGAATIAAVWSVAEHAGAPLSPALRGAAASLRDRAETVRDVRTSLAGPRATARLMAWLPAVGVGMAYAIGVDVVGALVGSPLGWGAGVAGLSLMAAGRAWTARLVGEASRVGAIAGSEHELMAIALAGGMSVSRARRLIAAVRAQVGMPADEGAAHSVDRVLRVAERAGAPAIELLAAEARQERRGARARGRVRAELLAVRLLLPLGVCVLPAFVLLGVVPVILAMVSSTFTGLM
ncbi:type II secretion system F family protein [uncultured Leifsonia sp.]|uniref:type II secretion system F family protein n=1 Tax=uncultured Leifsonia sp. TaxID=340359 RepID=UPI0025F0A965|nr:pilus assembly protein TadB [uncultured Leifsonia sp.]